MANVIVDQGTISGVARWTFRDNLGAGGTMACWIDGAPTQTENPDTAYPNLRFQVAPGAQLVIRWKINGTDPASVQWPWPEFGEIALFEDGSGTRIRTLEMVGLSPQPAPDPDNVHRKQGTVTFWVTHDGTQNGTPIRGMFRLYMFAKNDTGIPASGIGPWSVTTDGAVTFPQASPPADYTVRHQRGYIRSGAAITSVAISRDSFGGAAPPNNTLYFSNAQFWTVSMGAKLHNDNASKGLLDHMQAAAAKRALTMAFNAGTSLYEASSASGFATGINNLYAASATGSGVKLRFGTSTITGIPANTSISHFSSVPGGWSTANDANAPSGSDVTNSPTSATSPENIVTVDPRIQFVQLLQINDAAFGTPPLSKDVASGRRLPSDLGNVAARARNMNDQGISSLAWTSKLWDKLELTSSEASPAASRSVTSGTSGGETGWATTLFGWDKTLPSGKWIFKQVITTSQATGLEVSNSREFTLLRVDPAITPIIAIGASAEATDGDHWHAGDPLLVTVSCLNMDTGALVTLDSAPAIVLVRWNQTSERVEYLGSGMTWASATPGPVYEHVLTQSVADPKAYTLTFTSQQTSGWGDVDILAVAAKVTVGGTVYVTRAAREAVGRVNPHNSAIASALLGSFFPRL